MPPQTVWVLGLFGLKTGIHFAHFGRNQVWLPWELRECMNVFIVSIFQMNKKEIEIIMRIRNALEELFCALI